MNVTTISPLGSFRAAIAPFLADTWLITWIISARVLLARLAGRLVPRTSNSRSILGGIAFIGWLGRLSGFSTGPPAATAAHDRPCGTPWTGPVAARTASVTTLCRWATVSTSGSFLWWFFCCWPVNSACRSFAIPRAVPWCSVGTRASRLSSRPLNASVPGCGPFLIGPVGPVGPAGWVGYWGGYYCGYVGSISGGLL